MGFNLKDIENKLNSFNDKINEIGNQVSDALNKGASSLDGALNSCVNSIDSKVDEYVQKKEQEKLEKNENKGIDLSKEEPITLVKEEPVAEKLEGLGVQNEVDSPSVVKPAILVDLEKSDNADSVINQSSLDSGIGVDLEKK